ncbi:glycoside hydrolase family 43 protein [Xenorhabdus sp. Flor]|uniref:glycoside hydrolase family 43 protein n=1 Tax=Xenorhabdus cabanillasii TaxID=351673 RepID=UPI00199D13F8|nr:glycoside hydrolase family 43 protein [Xenorhabdus sp. Flor]MBD2814444.1 glycoside hydrolase family 43 protein [Xenorhabdus sp. Flor]
MIKNPILKGFNADPAICRRGDDYYIAVSSFEWFPGIPIYHSKDLENWTLHTHALKDADVLNLRNLRSAKGVWAPCLTWSEQDQKFYVLYGIMNSINGRYFDVDNYLITASEINGPWSKPVYLHSAGYDASIVHDDDGKKWVVAVDWETRDGHQLAISVVEYDPKTCSTVGYPKRIWQGIYGGGAEGAHITKRGEYYYIMCAEGGTGYGHCITMGRAKNILGPYEKDPENPILTSVRSDNLDTPVNIVAESAASFDKDYLRTECYNPDSVLQKSGHGSYVEMDDGSVFLVHLCSRPFVPELACTLGRETAIQKMYWTQDNWMRLEGGGNIAKQYVTVSSDKPIDEDAELVEYIDFNRQSLTINLYTPRIDNATFSSLTKRAGYLSLRGHDSLCSENKVSLVARKLTSVHATITTKMDFKPEVFQHSAGLVLYYDNMNYLFLQKTFDERRNTSVFYVIHVDNGLKKEDHLNELYGMDNEIYLRLNIKGKTLFFEWSEDDIEYNFIGQQYKTTLFSDEYSWYGEFTGSFVGLACVDYMYHRNEAHFNFLEYRAFEHKSVADIPE